MMSSAAFLSLEETICCGYIYSLEAPHRGASYEHPQYMFSSRNKKKKSIFGQVNTDWISGF